MNRATWIAYPHPEHISLKNAAIAVSRLHDAGVSVLALEGGVIAATGPAEWFTEENRLGLRRRAVALASYLERTIA